MGDSNYGVRSLGSEADWGGSSLIDDGGEDEIATNERQNHDQDQDDDKDHEETHADGGAPALSSSEAGRSETIDTPSGSARRAEEWTPTADTSALPTRPVHQSTTGSPTPPAADAHAISSAMADDIGIAEDQNQHDQPNTAPLSLSHAYLFEDRDNLSEPSSPASFASMPSYMSSLSRTSSLAGPEPNYQPMGIGLGMGGSEELVMPLLNVSQATSTGARWSSAPVGGGDRGMKVVVLGDEARTGDFIRELREIKEVVQLSRGEYAIIGGDQAIASISTGLNADEVRPQIPFIPSH